MDLLGDAPCPSPGQNFGPTLASPQHTRKVGPKLHTTRLRWPRFSKNVPTKVYNPGNPTVNYGILQVTTTVIHHHFAGHQKSEGTSPKHGVHGASQSHQLPLFLSLSGFVPLATHVGAWRLAFHNLWNPIWGRKKAEYYGMTLIEW